MLGKVGNTTFHGVHGFVLFYTTNFGGNKRKIEPSKWWHDPSEKLMTPSEELMTSISELKKKHPHFLLVVQSSNPINRHRVTCRPLFGCFFLLLLLVACKSCTAETLLCNVVHFV